MTEAELIAAVEHAMDIGPYACLCNGEEAKGYSVVLPGSVPWLPKEDWPDDVVITRKGKEVRIVAIYIMQEGNGAFSRLITGILKAGLKPIVVAPIGKMEEILKRWKWRQRIVGTTFADREDFWFPQRNWIEQRLSSQPKPAK